MARRTKEEAEKTRLKILAAARREFARRGVSRTSLDQIAKAAKVTRGAIYWHFKDKSELFFAMREQIVLPLHDPAAAPAQAAAGDPLDTLAAWMLEVMRRLREDPETRHTLEIICHKCEYVDEFETVLAQMLGHCSNLIGQFADLYRAAQAQKRLRPGADPAALALDTYLFFSGLVRLCAADPKGKVVAKPAALVKAHLDLRRG